jgi:hypothetical protein
MVQSMTNRSNSRVKRRFPRPDANAATGPFAPPKDGLSEEEVDRRAWAAANRIAPGPENLRSDGKRPR